MKSNAKANKLRINSVVLRLFIKQVINESFLFHAIQALIDVRAFFNSTKNMIFTNRSM